MEYGISGSLKDLLVRQGLAACRAGTRANSGMKVPGAAMEARTGEVARAGEDRRTSGGLILVVNNMSLRQGPARAATRTDPSLKLVVLS